MSANPLPIPTSLFVITAGSATIRLDPKTGKGQGAFTVSNTTDRPLRGRARVVPLEAAPAEWAGVPNAERDFAPKATEQYLLEIAVPPGTPPGSFKYQPYVAWVESTDDYSYAGPTFTVEVVAPAPPPPRRPWLWLIPVAVLLVLGLGGLAGWLGVQAKEREAAAAAQAAATATAQVLSAAAATATARAAATATVEATLRARVARYTGTWQNGDPQNAGITNLAISNSGYTIQVKVRGKIKDLIGPSGGLAQQPCPQECDLGEGNVAFANDPISVPVQTVPSAIHQLTITITPDGNTASAVDQVSFRGSRAYTSSYTFNLQRTWTILDRLPFLGRQTLPP